MGSRITRVGAIHASISLHFLFLSNLRPKPGCTSKRVHVWDNKALNTGNAVRPPRAVPVILYQKRYSENMYLRNTTLNLILLSLTLTS